MKSNKNSNVINRPTNLSSVFERQIQKETSLTPTYDKIIEEAEKLDHLSNYSCHFDYDIYKQLELRYKTRKIRGGIVKSSPLKLLNSHSSCQQCLYALELDSYGRGCIHNCVYCYAKSQLTMHGYWNNPIPVPIDINDLRRIFYTVFETDKKSKWRTILLKRIPIRIGCMSDSFMWIDSKYKVTKEVLNLLNYYRYPYTPLTRSDLIARDDYIKLLDKDLCNIQFSISSTNDELNKLIEPGAPSAKRRLSALKKLSHENFWTTTRINPIFPIYPEGYFSDPHFKWEGKVPKFEFSSFEMVDEIAHSGCHSIIAGFGRFSGYALNQIKKACGVDLRPFFNRDVANIKQGDYRYSNQEIRMYYEKYKQQCYKNVIEFTTCYIGNSENQFWDHQDIWSNKKDCCNIKGRVQSFQTDSREIPFEERVKFGHKCAVPNDPKRLYKKLGELKPVKSYRTGNLSTEKSRRDLEF